MASGTSTTVVVTGTQNMSVCWCRTYTLTRWRSTTAYNTVGATASNAGSVSGNINVPRSGALLSTVLNAASTGSITYSGVTEDADENVGNVNDASGHEDGLSAQTARTITATEAGASNTPEWALCAASWQ